MCVRITNTPGGLQNVHLPLECVLGESDRQQRGESEQPLHHDHLCKPDLAKRRLLCQSRVTCAPLDLDQGDTAMSPAATVPTTAWRYQVIECAGQQLLQKI